MESDQYSRNWYYGINSLTAYTSLTNLWTKTRQDEKDKETLEEEMKLAFSLHKPYQMPSWYRKTTVSGTDNQWQAELVEK